MTDVLVTPLGFEFFPEGFVTIKVADRSGQEREYSGSFEPGDVSEKDFLRALGIGDFEQRSEGFSVPCRNKRGRVTRIYLSLDKTFDTEQEAKEEEDRVNLLRWILRQQEKEEKKEKLFRETLHRELVLGGPGKTFSPHGCQIDLSFLTE